jgi:periplasmic mercuric ion binding protein
MKQFFASLFFALFSLVVAAQTAAPAPAQTPAAAGNNLKVGVNGMVCAFCAQGIEKTLTRMPETKAVYVNLEKKIVAIEPKAGAKLSAERVKKAISDSGYDVTKIEPTAESLDAIKQAAKSKA